MSTWQVEHPSAGLLKTYLRWRSLYATETTAIQASRKEYLMEIVLTSEGTSNEVSPTPELPQYECYRLTVLGADTKALDCISIQLSGRHFLVRISSPISSGACVAMTGNDDLLLGAVLGCWQQDSGFSAVIQFEHSLRGVHQLRQICGEFRD